MQTRFFLTFAALVAAVPTAFAADTTERTTMPDFCSRRDVNCVLLDAPSRVVASPRVTESAGNNAVGTLVTPSSGATLGVAAGGTLEVSSGSTVGAQAPSPRGTVPNVSVGPAATGTMDNPTKSNGNASAAGAMAGRGAAAAGKR